MFVLVLLVSLSGFALARECNEESCWTVRCGVTEETCRNKTEEFRPNSSSCGCCHTCVPYIPEGGSCGDCAPTYGEPPLVQHCQPGTECIKGKCVSKQ